jgi:hypothetical protein
MLSCNLYLLTSLTLCMNPHLGEFMHIIPHSLLSDEHVSSPLLSHTPHRRTTSGSRGATQRGVQFDLGGVSQLTFWRQGWTLV